jgi:hypothetical protein
MVRGQINVVQPNYWRKSTIRRAVMFVLSSGMRHSGRECHRKHRRIIVGRYILNSQKEWRSRHDLLNNESLIKRLREKGQNRENPSAAAILCHLRGYNSIKISVKRCASYNHPVFSGSSAMCAVVILGSDTASTYKFNGSNDFAGSRLAAELLQKRENIEVGWIYDFR